MEIYTGNYCIFNFFRIVIAYEILNNDYSEAEETDCVMRWKDNPNLLRLNKAVLWQFFEYFFIIEFRNWQIDS